MVFTVMMNPLTIIYAHMQNLYLRRLIMTAVFGLLSLPLLFAATIVVTSTADSGEGSLREAVQNAAPGDEIRFSSKILRQSIVLNSEIVIDKMLRIRGNGMGNTVIDGGGVTRIFRVDSEQEVYIGILTLTNGAAADRGGAIQNLTGTLRLDGMEILNSTAAGDAADMGGGAVHNAGSLQVTRVTFMNNSASGASGSGGAILNTAGGFSITRGNFVGNSASRAGGAIEDVSGSGLSRLNLTTMTGNSTGSAPGNGGGLHITGGSSLLVSGGTYTDNTAAREGGALWNGSGTMTIRGATISNNVASGDAADDGGGGVFNNGGTLRINAGTVISNNRADGMAGSGGGVFNATGGTLQIVGAEISGNTANRAGGGIEDASGSASLFTIANSMIDDNVVMDAPGNGGGIHIGSDGSLFISGGSVSGNQAGAEGGGIWNNSGTLVVSETTISGNTAAGDAANQGGGGLYQNEGSGSIVIKGAVISDNVATGASGSGGGILIDAGGTLTINDALVSGNTANRAGGGIEDASGGETMMTITNSKIDSNIVNNAPGNGGGIHVGGAGNVSFRGGTVNGNQAGAEGGGIWIATGTLTVGQNTVIDGNTAAGDDPDQGGGGLYNNGGGTINVLNGVVISNNRATGASGSGGGILNNTGATLKVDGAIISGNTANRAGGGIEDVSGDESSVTILKTDILNNTVGTAPGNGGGIHISGNGDMLIVNGRVNGNTAGREGGGLWNNAGTMKVIGTEIDGNTALGDGADDGGAGVFNNGGTMNLLGVKITNNVASGTSASGGGLLTTGGTVTVIGSTFSGNTANRAGGAVEQIDGLYSSTNNVYTNNTVGAAPGNGGAFHVTGRSSTVIFQGGEVSGNTAGNEGGGLWNQAGTAMTVRNVAIMNNVVVGVLPGDAGGGIFNNGGMLDITGSTIAGNTVTAVATLGGGIFNKLGGDLTLTNSTVSGNSTGGAGGGIASEGTISVTNATIAFNDALTGGGFIQLDGTLEISGSIIAENEATGGVWTDFSADINAVISGGYNLIGTDDQGNFPELGTDIEEGDANLAPLADNGGPTMTHALQCPSDAVDAGDPGSTDADQRGLAVFGGARDIGAFELQTSCDPFSPGGEVISTTARTFDVQIFPNPTSEGAVNVNLTEEMEGEVVLRLVDASGRLRSETTRQTGSTIRFPLLNLPNGTYTLQVISGETVTSRRLVIAN